MTRRENINETEIPWGPTGEVVYNRTYSRTKPNGTKETWPETVRRVAEGNLALVYGERCTWSDDVVLEHDRLVHYMERFAILPAGRHLWASGVRGRQYLFNCHVAGWGKKFSDHFEFTFMRLMEGGGVGANYSSRFLSRYGAPRRSLNVHIVCDPGHPDYQAMLSAGLISSEFSHEWEGCFAVEDSREGWAAALVDLLDTYMTRREVKHEDRVYDVSRVRGKGAPLRTFGGYASGPQPFAKMLHVINDVMNKRAIDELDPDWMREGFRGAVGHLAPTEAMAIDHAIAECVVSGGNRRSARMSICHWADPFIDDFLASKADPSKNWTTNISVEIDNEFLADLNPTPATHPELFPHFRDGVHDDSKPIEPTPAQYVHAAVVEAMLTNGEPGYWNSSLSNVGEVNEVVATNPCGEIALEEWENCNLGHVNLDAFAPTRKDGPHDILGLVEAHRLVTRFLIRATYGDVNDPKQADTLAKNRRIGVGHLGVQGFWAKKGVRYSKVGHSARARMLLEELYQEVRNEARNYAFELRIPEPVKATTLAPTGSIAKLPGVTEGGHPVLYRFFERRVRFSLTNPDEAATVADARRQGYQTEICQYDKSGNTAIVVYPTMEKLVAEVEAMGYDADMVESADEISLDDMLAFQALYQSAWADNAVSFTVNIPEGKYTADELGAAIARWLPQLKGTTVMVDGTRPQAPYTRMTREQFEACNITSIEDSTDEDCANGACPIR